MIILINELWKLQGKDRFELIETLPEREIGNICRLHKLCMKCPLCLVFVCKDGYERTTCADVPLRRHVYRLLDEGARFIEKK